MAFKIEDRVRETTTTTGTGTITLLGAVTNFETFTANLSNSDTTYYAIVDNTNGAFEVGLGTFTSSGTTLARSVIASSNSNNLVNFGVGTKDVFITVPASKIVVEDGSNNVAIGGTVTASAFSGSGASLTGVDVVNDTSPQLGGNLDVNGNDIISASGNANIEVAPHGTGGLVVKGNNTGSENQGKIILNCQDNTHGQTLKSQPHSASASNTLLLPSGSNDGSAQALVAVDITQTLTNKTLTSPVIETVTGSTITLDSAGDIVLDAGGADVTLKDDGTTYGSLTNSSGELVIKSGSTPTIAVTFSGANATFAGNLTVNGTTTTIDTTNTTVKDNLLELNSGVSSNSNDSGILIERGSTGDNALIMWDESEDRWVLGTSTSTSSATGNLNMTPSFLEIGGLVMPDVTAGKILVGDNTSYQEVAMSGDVAIASNGATTIQNDAVESGMLNDNVISGQTELASGLATTDELLVSDAGTLKRMDMSVVSTFMTSEGFSKDDPTALAIALG
tara:strand:- start:855 stop:2372 length:1518 start_codon:yes stop_codon:yes gene_type:complete